MFGALIDFELLGNSMTLLDNDIICVDFAGPVELLAMGRVVRDVAAFMAV